MKYVNRFEQAEYTSESLSRVLHGAAAIAITESMGLPVYLKLSEDARDFCDSSGVVSFEQKLDWALHTADASLDRIAIYSI